MKLSTNWLKEYISIGCSEKEFSDKMTMSGSKVETISNQSEILKNIVVGKIIKISKHENADSLVVCILDVGACENIQIVTGATNVFEGALVPVALHKSIISGGKKIKRGNLRGVKSDGMLCSIQELGCSLSQFPYAIEDGIFIIEEKCNIGDDINAIIGNNDTVIEFEITPNRVDCFSIIGLAIEAAATLEKTISFPPILSLDKYTTLSPISVKLEKNAPCKKYMTIYIKDVSIKPSPKWMIDYLLASGISPVNNIVDITNFAMLEYGQPLHAFDADKISNNSISIRMANKDEKILALNSKEYTLNEKDLVISDSEKILAIAGVIGGISSSITSETKNILIESAIFDASNIRITSQKIGVRTESSLRFEKDISSAYTKTAIQRVCKLIDDFKIGKIYSKLESIDLEEKNIIQIPLDMSFINSFLGINITEKQTINILENLQLKINNNIITPPLFRIDIEDKFDIAEEIARIFGYNNIPSTLPKTYQKATKKPFEKFISNIHNIAISSGCSETISFPFIGEKDIQTTKVNSYIQASSIVNISNPMGEETSMLTPCTFIPMIKNLALNFKNQNKEVMLYEISKEYKKDKESSDTIETYNITIGSYGPDRDFFYVKGIVENILDFCNINNYSISPTSSIDTLHPYRCCEIYVGSDKIATIGEINPIVLDSYNVSTRCAIGKVNIDLIFSLNKQKEIYTPISKFPSSYRDLSLICDYNLPVIEIKNIIEDSIGEILENIELFDIYQGDQIECGKKSVSYNIQMRGNDKTLEDHDIDTAIDTLLTNLKQIDVRLRY
ncbi:MAG: phenylalanine--tRNA ligase subunit beta [Oscillospiraceae bacterium]|nr:phenylalanine--tRNA ligase subunit beta [Oscillospiraceae bacterium]